MKDIPHHVVRLVETPIYQGDVRVLDNVTFSIEKGDFVYLVGQTGSGKSSLLKTLYADLPLQEGTVHVAGFNLRQLTWKSTPFLRRRIGVVFQDFQLLFDRTLTENLRFVLQAIGWKQSTKIKQRIAEVLMQVGLGAIDNKLPHQLSGGQQQRLCIARALLNEPIILLADEPTGNLDPDVSDGILQLFLDINSAGTAVLMATHNYSFISSHPARVLQCKEGRLEDSHKKELLINERLSVPHFKC